METWTFVHATDIHVGSPRSFRFWPELNENWQTARQQILEIDPDFLLLGGDLTRDGRLHKYELEAVKADLDALPFPYHVVAGNMDTGNKHTQASGPQLWEGPYRSGTQDDDVNLNLRSRDLEQFSSVFGPLWWSFVHKSIRVSGFCDTVAGSGLPEETDFWRWMASQSEHPQERHHVWITHYPLFIDDPHESNFDISDPDQYQKWYDNIDEPARSRIMTVLKATGTDLVISGHVHCRKVHYADGIRFDIAPSTAFSTCRDGWQDGDPTRGFLRYDVTEGGIASTFVPLEKDASHGVYGPLVPVKGYGQGGHPAPDRRDYSAAWDRAD